METITAGQIWRPLYGPKRPVRVACVHREYVEVDPIDGGSRSCIRCSTLRMMFRRGAR